MTISPQPKERPILFSAPMVRAILEGRKTVTRRAVKGFQIPTEDTAIPVGDRQRWSAIGQRDPRYGFCVFGSTEAECAKELEEYAPCPYGKPGDRLWVREAWAEISVAQAPGESWVVYRECDNRTDYGGPWKPSIHMRRRDSRILLEITDVRVERLQDISEEQAKAEGVRLYTDHAELGDWWHVEGIETYSADPRKSFELLWSSVGGDWQANPWVWVVEFKRVTP
ncbi:hypothetical protein PSH81_14115 [Pseudomonas sp. FP2335]|uniref:hypothetical protein n=1 Tax=Pseudomonas sp. FP2335 TaxID=2954092 RepID=UPI002732ED9B|nr:hypothetical protein [Pseudomonas sp. FP2335]WLH76894.1 hypothetical protein PSH81_14115 [Pseudomonas sp. FP2335]